MEQGRFARNSILRIMLPFLICALSFTEAALGQNAIKEYIYLGDRIVAVESGAASGGSFSVSIAPSSREMQPGQSAEFTVTVAASDGFTGNVNLSIPTLSSTITAATFSPAVIQGGAGSSTLSITTQATTPFGPYSFTVKGTSGSIERDASPGLLTVTSGGSLGNPECIAIGQSYSGTGCSYTNGVFSVQGAGDDIYGNSDQFQFFYWQLTGDGTIVARVASAQNLYTYSKTGVMIRDSLTAGSINAFALLYGPAGTLGFQWRTTTNGSTAGTFDPTVGRPYWLKLVRQGNAITAFASPNGINWSQIGSPVTLQLGPVAYVGFAVSSWAGANITTALFDNVTVSSAASDFYVAPMPQRQIVTTAGGTARYQLVVNSVNGTTQAVSFAATGLPSGASASFSPATASAGAATTLEITVPAGVAAGTYSLQVAGVAGGVSHTLALTLTVTNPFDGKLPDTWLNENIGISYTGTGSSYNTGTFTVQGAGDDIYGNSDQFHFAYQTLKGDGSIVARVVGAQNLYTYSKTGVMIRDGLTAGSMNAFALLYGPGGTLGFQWRTTTNGSTAGIFDPTVGRPYWLKLVRQGNAITAFASPNGINWTQIGSPVTLQLGPVAYVGFGVSSWAGGNITTALFDNVTVSSAANDFYVAPMPQRQIVTTAGGTARYQLVVNSVNGTTPPVSFTATGLPSGASASFSPATAGAGAAATLEITVPAGAAAGTYSPQVTGVAGAVSHTLALTLTVTNPFDGKLPDTWLNENIGISYTGTGSSYNTGTFTVQGAGDDIYGNSDQFHFAYQTLKGDGSIVARVVGAQNLYTYSKTGVMIRDSLTAGSMNAFALLYGPAGTLGFQWRTTTNGSTAGTFDPTLGRPYWLKLVRQGNTITAFASPNGVNWTQIGSPVTLQLGPVAYVGFAVSSWAGGNITTGLFDNVTVSGTANDFYVAPMPQRQIVTTAGGTARYQLVVNSLNGTTPLVSFTATGLPAGASASFSPTTAGAGAATTFQITVPPSAAAGTYTPQVTGVAGGISHTLPLTLTVIEPVAGNLPDTWLNENVGISYTGTGSSYNTGTFTVLGAGDDIWGNSDQFHFAYQTLKGDGSIVARVVGAQNVYTYSKTGVMIRDSLTPGSMNAFALLYGAGGTLGFQSRTTTTGGTTGTFDPTVGRPYWLKLVRQGNTVTAFASANGTDWTQIGSPVTLQLGPAAYVGFAVSSWAGGNVTTALFDNVSVTPGP